MVNDQWMGYDQRSMVLITSIDNC